MTFESFYYFPYVWVEEEKKVPHTTYGLSEISAIKQHPMARHNKFKSCAIRKILINDTKIIDKNNNENHL